MGRYQFTHKECTQNNESSACHHGGAATEGSSRLIIVPLQNNILDCSSTTRSRQALKVIFLIKKEVEEAFKETIGNRIGKYMDGL